MRGSKKPTNTSDLRQTNEVTLFFRMECFICADERRPLYKACLCNQWVHIECLQHMVDTVPSHSRRCSICLKIYETNGVRYSLYMYPNIYIRISMVIIQSFACCNIIILISSIIMSILSFDAFIFFLSVSFFCLSNTVFGLLQWRFYIVTGRFFAFGINRKIRVAPSIVAPNE